MVEGISCTECGSNNVVKKGRSKTKFQSKQIYKCNNCGKRFVSGFGKSYPAKIIIDSIISYNLGNNLAKSSKIIKTKHKVTIPEKTIYSWVKEFDKVCSYYRIRKEAIKLFKPKDIIFKKIFRHLQLYKFRFHKAKLEFFANGYFKGLKNYLVNISENCPDELFKGSARSSNVKLNIDADKIKIFKKENYACRLASLALQSANNNYERHDKLQEFMLVNDTCAIATEVPVYLFLDEIKEYGILELFEKISIKNTSNEKHDNENTITTSNNQNSINDEISKKSFDNSKNIPAITGHIDFVQLKFGSVYVLDYKPNASKVDAVSQLFVYALALSIRTGIWLRNFKCAWFDENGYYEFTPSDIVLKFCHVPQNRFKEFFVRNKERRYFTSKEFQQNKKNLRFKRDNGLRNISSGQIGSVMQSGTDMFFGKFRKVAFDYFVLRNTSTKQLKNLPNHNPSSLKSQSSAADFGVSDNVLVNFDSHTICSDNPIFKGADIWHIIANLSLFSQYIGKNSYYVSKYDNLASQEVTR